MRLHFFFPSLLLGCGSAPARPAGPADLASGSTGIEGREEHFADLLQLTSAAGENAEAYWSWDGSELIMQSTRPPFGCDQIFRLPLDPRAEKPALVSTGKGRTTCAYFYPGNQRILYASTHAGGEACPPPPDRSQGYVWALHDYDIYQARVDGSAVRPVTATPGYDAEATVCGTDGSIVFTSTRDGDLELYRMDANGSPESIRRLTHAPGYDGGAFFSADCSKLVWRASRPQLPEELEDYQRLLKQGLVRPSKLELWVANADGSEARQITYFGAATFAPYFFPNGDRVIFSSNVGDPNGREFDLWAVDTDGTRLERISYAPGFDGFPMFSPDGKRVSFSSNRHQANPGETDVFVARWIDEPIRAEERAPDRVMADVRWLADDAREGRGVGTQGLKSAAAWLATRFGDLGLEPAGVAGTYRHEFQVTTKVKTLPETGASIDGEAIASEDFSALGFSGQAAVEAQVVVAGHGITAPEVGHDDYAKLDRKVKGKVVVVRRHTPESGPWEKDELIRRYGDLHYKAWNAREHGAVGLVVVDAPVRGKGAEPAETPLPKLVVEGHGDVGIPVVVVRRQAGAALLDGKRHRVRMRVALAFEKEPAENIIGRITAGAGAAERLPGVVVVGAHYDHLGFGGTASLAPDVVAPHNGADDNASGTAALLEVARTLRSHRAELRRDVVLVAFSGEESGVLGSTALVRTPPPGFLGHEVVAMLNMDMVGRMRDNRLQVLGGESAKEWPELVAPACNAAGVTCTIGGDGYGPSDQMPFFAAGAPVLHFFTGAHGDYHKPSDDSALINAAGTAQVATIVADLAVRVGGRESRLTLQAAKPPTVGGDARSYGASLGTIPDYQYSGTGGNRPGVLLAGVRPGSPAEVAGMRRGDLLVRIGQHDIRSIEDFMFVLRSSKPGDRSSVVVARDGKPVELEVVFGRR